MTSGPTMRGLHVLKPGSSGKSEGSPGTANVVAIARLTAPMIWTIEIIGQILGEDTPTSEMRVVVLCVQVVGF
jgi:hypothetical protein